MVLGGGPCPGSEIHNYNPFYSDGFSHINKYKKIGIVQYIFQGVPDRNQKSKYLCTSVPLDCIILSKQTIFCGIIYGSSLFGKVPL